MCADVLDVHHDAVASPETTFIPLSIFLSSATIFINFVIHKLKNFCEFDEIFYSFVDIAQTLFEGKYFTLNVLLQFNL